MKKVIIIIIISMIGNKEDKTALWPVQPFY